MADFNPYGYRPQTGTGGAVTPDVDAIDMARLVQMRHENIQNDAIRKQKEEAAKKAKDSDLYKSIYALDRDWYAGDLKLQEKMLKDIYAAAIQSDGQPTNQIMQMVSDFKAVGDKSKEFNTKYLEFGKEVPKNTYLNAPEVMSAIEANEYTLPDGKTVVKTDEIQSPVEYGNVLGARYDLLQSVIPDYDTPKRLTDRAAFISNPKTIVTDAPDGGKITETITDDKAIKYALKQDWIDNKAMRDKESYVFEKRKKANPDELVVIDEKGTTKKIGDMTAEEYFIESNTPLFRKQKEVHKYAPSSAGYGKDATSEDWQKNATKATTIRYGVKNEQVPSIANFTLTETPTTFSASEAIDLGSGGKYNGNVTSGTLGQVHIIAVHKNTGLPITGGDITSGKDKDVEYRPMIVLKTDPKQVDGETVVNELLVPVSVGRGAAESKESAEERKVLNERLDWAQKKADDVNKSISAKSAKTYKFTKEYNGSTYGRDNESDAWTKIK